MEKHSNFQKFKDGQLWGANLFGQPICPHTDARAEWPLGGIALQIRKVRESIPRSGKVSANGIEEERTRCLRDLVFYISQISFLGNSFNFLSPLLPGVAWEYYERERGRTRERRELELELEGTKDMAAVEKLKAVEPRQGIALDKLGLILLPAK
ncbi:hypothetical protein H6P81_003866 [Aristolochia fimbriata]|uniref:Uncharacterized protein n=1 Tax=Aristolochia fimbriata TaxID=158543 RepID=A0AAV7FEM3_ARIFI|nr:hypothetical protein H6P81_003866 [Aristolochia fimbriata]